MARVEHWDRDRYAYERERGPFGGERRERVESHDHHYHGPPASRIRDHSGDRQDRRPRDFDDDFVRDRRYYHDEPYLERRREVVREVSPAPPPRRPGVLRRQSSLDTFDRRPLHFYEREEYGPPARREPYRPEPYVPIPVARTKPAPRPRPLDERFVVEDIRVADPEYYGDEILRPYPERVRETEVVRARRRPRSPDSLTSRTYTRTSRSSSASSRSSSRSRATTVRSEYPKKGKTRIPTRLVSKRALIDLGYPFLEEGNAVIILKALSKENIDEVLRISEEYRKSELETLAARSSAGNILEERREEVYVAPPPPPPPPQAPAAEVEMVRKETVFRDVSPTRTTTATSATTTTDGPLIRDAAPAGPLVIRSRSKSRSRSRGGRRELRSEILALEAERRRRHGHRGDVVLAERLDDGGLVLYEESVEDVREGRRGPRIEKDRKGPPPGVLNLMLKTLT